MSTFQLLVEGFKRVARGLREPRAFDRLSAWMMHPVDNEC